MVFTSDLVLDGSRFNPESIRPDLQKVTEMLKSAPKSAQWYEVGAAKYRAMRESGETVLPIPVFLAEAQDAVVPSRDAGRSIPIRIIAPKDGASKGIMLHIHGGGFVLDTDLKELADGTGLTTISVGYRLAPEHPYPAGINDCIDAADYLIRTSESDYGAKVLFLTGESSGACLAALTTFHILRSHPEHNLAGFVSKFGHFNVASDFPSTCSSHGTLVIDYTAMQHFGDAYVPGKSSHERKDPKISPVFEDMQLLASSLPSKKLPPALFLVGTADPLLDDTLFMGAKWLSSGSEAVVKLYPGAYHGFTLVKMLKDAQDADQLRLDFVLDKLNASP